MKIRTLLILLIVSVLFTAAHTEPVFADDPVLGPAPLMPPYEAVESVKDAVPVVMDAQSGHTVFLPFVLNRVSSFAVINNSRQSVLNFYNTYYLDADYPAISWTGTIGSCNAGSTSVGFKEAVANRINFFREMAGVPAMISLNETYNAKAQAAALVMSANNSLNHTPPSTWTCYSDLAYSGASSANLALGAYGTGAIGLYMKDHGSSNGAVGHRRWLLYPQTQEMGTGDVPYTSGHYAANALVVFDSHIWETRPETRFDYVAWPPPGYIPYTIVYPRWSFSYPKADFSAATVQMTKNGSPITQIQLESVQNGYGENTLVWIPLGLSNSSSWPQPQGDETYRVTINNVKISGQTRSFSYEVVIITP